jgi:uncharacterized protein YjdB
MMHRQRDGRVPLDTFHGHRRTGRTPIAAAPRHSLHRCWQTSFAALLATVVAACGGGEKPLAPPTVTPAQAAKVVVTPDTVRLAVADSLIAEAVATLASGQPATDPVTWTSSNPTVASVDASGLVVATGVGNAVLTARSGPVSGTARIEVALGQVSAQGRVSGPGTFTVTSTPEEIASGTITLTRANSSLTFAPGDVLVGQEAGGYLRKIQTVTTNGNVVTATTTDAELPEAFDAGTIDFEEDLDFASAPASSSLTKLAPIAGMTIGRNGMVHFSDAQIPFNIDVTAGSPGAAAQIVINLKGDLAFLSGKGTTGAPTFTIKDKWGRKKKFPWTPELKSFEMNLTAGAKLDAIVSATITGAVPSGGRKSRGEREILSRVLTKGPKGITCSLFGPIPVCYKITAKLIAFVEPDGGPRATVEEHVIVSAGSTAGLKYSGGQLTPVFTPFSSSSFLPPEIKVEGDIGVRFGIEPKLEVEFYSAGGPEVGIPLGIEVKGGLQGIWAWYVDPKFFADLALGVQAKVFGFGLRGEWEAHLVDKPFSRISGPLASLAVSPPSVTIGAGQTSALTATATSLLTGTSLGTPQGLAWTSSNAGVATVSASGVVTAVGAGTATITATIPGTSINATSAFTVQSSSLVDDVHIAPTTLTVNVGLTATINAAARKAGQVLSLPNGALTWISSAPAIATVTAGGLPPNATGIVTGVSAGTATICARSVVDPTKEGCTTVNSQRLAPATITVSVASSLTAGQQSTATATLRDAAGAVLTGRTVTWQTSNASVAIVGNTTGIVTAVAPGLVDVIGTSDGVQGRAPLTVQAAAVASVTLTVTSTTVTAGATTQATATPRDAAGNPLQRPVTFASNNPAVATVTASGLITGVSAGTALITAGSEGQTASVNITVVPAAALALVSTSPTNGASGVSIESTVAATFSLGINATTVNSTTFRVTMFGNVLPGTYAVNGATVTFTPTTLLGENSPVVLTIGTGLKSTTGAALASTYTANFSIALFDANYYYRFFNNLTGQASSLDTYSNTLTGFMGPTGGYSGQYWYMTPAAGSPGYYIMKNSFKGDLWYLEGADGIGPVVLQNTSPTVFTGQMWRFTGNSFGPGCFALQNLNFGATKSMANVNGTVIMQPTAATGAQCFSIARIGHR